MLRVTFIGNLGAAPEERYSAKGTKITSFRAAVNQVRNKPDSDERVESTEWFRVQATGRLGDFAARLGKGNRVLVIGRLDISHFQNREGVPQTGFDVWADEIQGIRTGGGNGEARGEEGVVIEPQGATVGSNVSDIQGRRTQPADTQDLEDLPF